MPAERRQASQPAKRAAAADVPVFHVLASSSSWNHEGAARSGLRFTTPPASAGSDGPCDEAAIVRPPGVTAPTVCTPGRPLAPQMERPAPRS